MLRFFFFYSCYCEMSRNTDNKEMYLSFTRMRINCYCEMSINTDNKEMYLSFTRMRIKQQSSGIYHSLVHL